jgi:hypothetical protein
LVRRPPFGLSYQSRMMDDVECGAISGGGIRSTRICRTQIPHDLARAQSRAAAVRNGLSCGCLYPPLIALPLSPYICPEYCWEGIRETNRCWRGYRQNLYSEIRKCRSALLSAVKYPRDGLIIQQFSTFSSDVSLHDVPKHSLI